MVRKESKVALSTESGAVNPCKFSAPSLGIAQKVDICFELDYVGCKIVDGQEILIFSEGKTICPKTPEHILPLLPA